MPVLQQAQDIYGYLPIEVQKIVADGLGMPLEEVYGVATFYSQFSLSPKGEYDISVCLGTACYVKGAQKILESLSEQLGIGADECTEDGRFSLSACRCIGACALAPAMSINGKVYSKVTPDQVGKIIDEYRTILKPELRARLGDELVDYAVAAAGAIVRETHILAASREGFIHSFLFYRLH